MFLFQKLLLLEFLLHGLRLGHLLLEVGEALLHPGQLSLVILQRCLGRLVLLQSLLEVEVVPGTCDDP